MRRLEVNKESSSIYVTLGFAGLALVAAMLVGIIVLKRRSGRHPHLQVSHIFLNYSFVCFSLPNWKKLAQGLNLFFFHLFQQEFWFFICCFSCKFFFLCLPVWNCKQFVNCRKIIILRLVQQMLEMFYNALKVFFFILVVHVLPTVDTFPLLILIQNYFFFFFNIKILFFLQKYSKFYHISSVAFYCQWIFREFFPIIKTSK